MIMLHRVALARMLSGPDQIKIQAEIPTTRWANISLYFFLFDMASIYL